MMTEEMKSKLKHLVVTHEDYRKYPYVDSVGRISIGIGYNLSDRGISDKWINSQYEADVAFFYQELSDTFPWFGSLNDARKIALIDMCFMGFKKFCEFKLMLRAFCIRDYKTAAFELLHSEWAKEVKGRAIDLAKIIETGIL